MHNEMNVRAWKAKLRTPKFCQCIYGTLSFLLLLLQSYKVIMVDGAEAAEIAAKKFDWLELKQEITNQRFQDETFREKLVRKIQANPVVPVGCLVTLGALTYGLWSFRSGKRQMSQYMMRLRIGAQGFTIVALLVGVGLAATKKK